MGSGMPCHVAADDDSDDGPVTDKCSGDGAYDKRRIMWGYSSMQGWRPSMEDAHVTIQSLGEMARSSNDSRAVASAPGWDDTAAFGVFDGHGGPQVARFCERHLPVAIARCPADDITGALTTAFLDMDEMLKKKKCLEELRSLSDSIDRRMPLWRCSPMTIGSTVIVACIRPDSITVANAGDCRAVLSRAGHALDLSKDHKPEDPLEMQRIKQAGGWVEAEDHGDMPPVYRMNGDLSLSRSIGDLEYKQNTGLAASEQLISAVPDVQTFRRELADEFMLMACDGVWDVISSQAAVDFVRIRLGPSAEWAKRIKSGDLEISSVLEDLLDHCLSPDLHETDGLGGDNMTTVLVLFVQQGQHVTPVHAAHDTNAARAALGVAAPAVQQVAAQHMNAAQSQQQIRPQSHVPHNSSISQSVIRLPSGPQQAVGQTVLQGKAVYVRPK